MLWPREVDGHQHVHTCLNVLFARSLGNVEAMRATFNLPPDDASAAKRAVRRLINGVMRLRFESTQRFTYLRKENSCRSFQDLAHILARANAESVELMTHPGIEDECNLLLSNQWAQQIAGARLGTFGDL